MSEKTIIEINGIKMEVDLRYANKLDCYKVGDNVKVLVKDYSGYKSNPGVIIGFDEFKMLPTIIVCYISCDYTGKVNFAYINNESKDIELCHMNEHEVLIDKEAAVQQLDRELDKKRAEVLDLEYKKSYFLEKYNQYLNKESL